MVVDLVEQACFWIEKVQCFCLFYVVVLLVKIEEFIVYMLVLQIEIGVQFVEQFVVEFGVDVEVCFGGIILVVLEVFFVI